MRLITFRLRRLLPTFLLAVAASYGCGEDAVTDPGTRLGAVRGVVETTGHELDPDGYTVAAAGEQGTAAVQDTVLLTGLEPGNYPVELGGVAANCSVAGDNPRSVTVVAGDTAEVRFSVSCAATDGTVRVITTTAGAEPDPDGYTVTVGDGSGTAVATDDTLDVTAEAGDVSVRLSGVAGNCSVAGSNPRTLTVVAGDTAGTTFAVDCPATGSGGDGGDGGDDDGGGGTSGSIRVITSTSGSSQDPDGYSFTVDGGSGTAIGLQDTVVVSAATGGRSVQLGGVAGNCSVGGANPRSVTVAAGDTVDAAFSVSCGATSGSIRVVTSTTGSDQDPDGYTFTVDGGSGTAIARNDTVYVGGLAAGDHDVALGGVAGNCSVGGTNPRTVTVAAGDTVEAAFGVSCTATSGSIRLVTSTTGSDQDPDGYTFAVDGGSETQIGTTDTVTVSAAPGDHSVQLTVVAGNCSVSGNNPRTLSVTAGDTVTTTFDVSCTATSASARIVYGRTGDGFELWSVGLDGSDRRQITDPPSGSNDNHPEYSPDATRIVFDTDREDPGGQNAEVYVVNADGTGMTNLTNHSGRDVLPVWSPAGGSIAWNSDRDGSMDIWTMNEDGSGATNLSPGSAATDEYPAWTPDGSRVAFATNRDGNFEIYIVDDDGSNPVRLTNHTARDRTPSVSPDGTKIAFTSRRDGNDEIYVMGIDGSGIVRLTNDPAVDEQPVWTSDGRIAFTSNRSGRDIWIMDADGSSLQRLTSSPGADEHPGATK